MKGDPAIIEALNEVLTAELTAINQYYIHYKMCENWGYLKIAQHSRGEAMEEMQHADKVIERILFLDGIPNMQRLFPVKVGETVKEQLELDLALELEAVKRLNTAVALCTQKGDNGSRMLVESILKDEEEAIDWGEAQLGIIREIGFHAWLAEQLTA
ncbi:MAG TPA: bacterioferritin [Planctomycetota bacterium]|jgi:bacterioferritin|nr:bacterioferritin [Planctomycetota bacterium]